MPCLIASPFSYDAFFRRPEGCRRSRGAFAFGGAAHTGKLQTSRLDRKELGSRVLFYLATELGYRITPKHSVSLRVDHMSNASLADNNEGLDTVGLIYGYHF